MWTSFLVSMARVLVESSKRYEKDTYTIVHTFIITELCPAMAPITLIVSCTNTTVTPGNLNFMSSAEVRVYNIPHKFQDYNCKS